MHNVYHTLTFLIPTLSSLPYFFYLIRKSYLYTCTTFTYINSDAVIYRDLAANMGSTQSSTPEIIVENRLAPGDSDLHASVQMEHYGALGVTVALGVLLAIVAGALFWWLRRRCCNRRRNRRRNNNNVEQGIVMMPVQNQQQNQPAPPQVVAPTPAPAPVQPIIQPVIVQPREDRSAQYTIPGYNPPVEGIPDWDDNYVPGRYVPRSPSAPDISVNALALQKAYNFYKNNPQIKPPAAFLNHCPNFATRTTEAATTPGPTNWQAITPEALAKAISALNSNSAQAAAAPQPPPAPAPSVSSVAWEGMVNHM